MDTNQVLQLLISAFAQKQTVAPVVVPVAQTPWLIFAGMAFAALPAILAWWTAYDTKRIAVKTATQLETVRIDVNKNFTTVTEQLNASRLENVKMSELIAKFEERGRAQVTKDAVREAVAIATQETGVAVKQTATSSTEEKIKEIVKKELNS